MSDLSYWDIPTIGAGADVDRIAIVAADRTLTWRELIDRLERVAAVLLDAGLRPGGRVGVMAHNGWLQAELYYGISLAGGVVVPLNWRLSARELADLIADAQVERAFVQSAFRESLPTDLDVIALPDPGVDTGDYERLLAGASGPAPRPDVDEDDVTMIAYTSGTTGRPKGVMHSHRSLLESAMRLANEMRLERDDAFYACLPMFFAGANSTMSTPLLRGCTIVVEDFSVDGFVDACERHAISATIMVPTMIGQILRHERAGDAALSGVERWSYAGAPMPKAQLQRAVDRFGPVFIQLYGQLETGLLGCTLTPEDHAVGTQDHTRLESAGQPTFACAVRIVDLETGADVPPDSETPGEVWLRGPSVMRGYWGQPELTAEVLRDGWVHTGDIAVLDPGGYVRLVDRASDKIITGGINVFPSEVEEVVAEHPLVDEVAVVGMPSEEWGEEITACVTLSEPVDHAQLTQEITALCAERLAGYKKPRRVFVLDELPRTGSGKIAKPKLRDGLRAAGQRDA